MVGYLSSVAVDVKSMRVCLIQAGMVQDVLLQIRRRVADGSPEGRRWGWSDRRKLSHGQYVLPAFNPGNLGHLKMGLRDECALWYLECNKLQQR